MRIGIVLSSTPSYSETFFLSKIKGLQDNGHKVIVFSQLHGKDFKICPVKLSPRRTKSIFLQFINFTRVYISLIPYLGRLVSFYQLEKKDGILTTTIIKKIYLNAHLLKANLDWIHFGFATLAVGKENIALAINAKMGVSLRGFDINVFPLKKPNCYDKLWQRVDKVHAISDYLYKKSIDLGLSAKVQYAIISPAFDLQEIDLYKKIKKKPKQIVTAARLHWIKGLKDSIKAMKELKDKKVNFHYTIIGEGKMMEELKFMIYELDLKKEISLLGRMTHKETLKNMAESEVYLQYSLSEGYCNAALEAQALGLLTVVSNGGALSENVVDKYSGWVVEKEEPEMLANKLIDIMNLSNDEKSIIIENAQDRVKKDFNLKLQAIRFNDFYFNYNESKNIFSEGSL